MNRTNTDRPNTNRPKTNRAKTNRARKGRANTALPKKSQPEITLRTSAEGRSREAGKHKQHARSHASSQPERKPRITGSEFIAQMLGYADRCPNGHCRRARRCCGETCIEVLWPREQEKTKAAIRTMILCRKDGLSAEDAHAAGMSVYDNWEAQQARWAASMAERKAALAPKPPEPAPPKAERNPKVMPRVRAL